MFSTAAATDGELRYYDEEQAFLEVSVDEKMHIEVPEEYQTFLGATGVLNKIYWLVQAEKCRFNNFRNGRTAIGFEQSEADSCVFRKFDNGEVEMVVVVHVNDNLGHAKGQATMKRFATELGSRV